MVLEVLLMDFIIDNERLLIRKGGKTITQSLGLSYALLHVLQNGGEFIPWVYPPTIYLLHSGDRDKTNSTEYVYHQLPQSDYQTWKNYVTDWWNTIKLDAKRDDKQIFVSNLFVLQMFPNDLDRVIDLPYDVFIERMKCRGHYCEGRTEAWKTAINKAIRKIPQHKVFSTDKYLSDILNNY